MKTTNKLPVKCKIKIVAKCRSEVVDALRELANRIAAGCTGETTAAVAQGEEEPRIKFSLKERKG